MTSDTRTQITQMHNEGVTTQGNRTLTNDHNLRSLRNMNYPETEINKITGKGGFVERRCLVTTFSVQTTDPPAKFLYKLDPNVEIFKQKNIRDKLNNLSAMEADLNVVLQVNCSPFNQGGIYGYTYLPDEANPYDPTQFENITYITSKDGIHMLFGGETEVSYRIPYISPQANYSLNTAIPNGVWPHFYVHVFSPLESVNDTKVDVSVYIELQNVKTHMPTLQTITPVSMLDLMYDKYSKTLAHNKEEKLKMLMYHLQTLSHEELSQMYPPSPHLPAMSSVIKRPIEKTYAESAVDQLPEELTDGGKHEDVHQKEEKQQLENPISLGLAKVGDLAKELITDLPISDIFEVPTWLGDPVKRLLGFAKPLNTTASNRVTIAPQNNMCNADVSTSMTNFGLFGTNRLAYKPVFESDQDEMNLNFITSKPAIIDTFTIQKTDAAGTILYTHPVSPMSFLRATATDPIYMTPLSFIASLFESWAGDIDYTFYIIKTPITNCRIQIGFSPALQSITSTDDTFMAYNTIYDLKDLQVINFKAIWAHNNVFKSTSPNLFAALSPDNTWRYNTGLLYVKLINEFTGNASVPEDIVIKVAHSSSNICFANPRTPRYAPMQTGTPPTEEKTFAESGVDMDVGAKEEQEIILVPAPLGQQSKFTFDRFTYAMGEVILSLKQLLLRFSLSDVFVNSNNVADLIFFAYFPYQLRCVLGHNSYTRTFDYLDYIGSAYALKRGNVRLLVLCDWQDYTKGYWQGQHLTEKNWVTAFLPAFDEERGTVNTVDWTGSSYYIFPTQIVQSCTNGTFEAQFPNYTNSTCTFNHKFDLANTLASQTAMNDDWIEPSFLSLRLPQPMPNGGRIYVYRAVDPNFQFGFWNGTPPLHDFAPSAKAIPTPS